MATPGLQHAAFGVGETGVIGPRERVEGSFEGFQARGGLLGGGAEARCALGRRRRLGRPGIAQKHLPGGPILHGAVAREEGGGLPGVEGVAIDHPGELHLRIFPEGAQSERGGEREASLVEQEPQRGGELAREGEATLDPGALPAQELADRLQGQLVVVGQGRRDVRLVHGTDGAGRSVRRQEAGLHDEPGGEFDHDGDLAAALGTPDAQTLEAVDHLVDAVAGRRDAQGERSEKDPFVAALAAEAAQGGPEAVQGDELDDVHGGPSSGRIWKSGYR